MSSLTMISKILILKRNNTRRMVPKNVQPNHPIRISILKVTEKWSSKNPAVLNLIHKDLEHETNCRPNFGVQYLIKSRFS